MGSSSPTPSSTTSAGDPFGSPTPGHVAGNFQNFPTHAPAGKGTIDSTIDDVVRGTLAEKKPLAGSEGNLHVAAGQQHAAQPQASKRRKTDSKSSSSAAPTSSQTTTAPASTSAHATQSSAPTQLVTTAAQQLSHLIPTQQVFLTGSTIHFHTAGCHGSHLLQLPETCNWRPDYERSAAIGHNPATSWSIWSPVLEPGGSDRTHTGTIAYIPTVCAHISPDTTNRFGRRTPECSCCTRRRARQPELTAVTTVPADTVHRVSTPNRPGGWVHSAPHDTARQQLAALHTVRPADRSAAHVAGCICWSGTERTRRLPGHLERLHDAEERLGARADAQSDRQRGAGA